MRKAVSVLLALFVLAVNVRLVAARGLATEYPAIILISPIGDVSVSSQYPTFRFYTETWAEEYRVIVERVETELVPVFDLSISSSTCDGAATCEWEQHLYTLGDGYYAWRVQGLANGGTDYSILGVRQYFYINSGLATQTPMSGFIATATLDFYDDVYCLDDYPAGWLTVTPNAAWDIMCSACYKHLPSTGTPTPYGQPTGTATVTPNATATQQAQVEYWLDYVGRCVESGTYNKYAPIRCNLYLGGRDVSDVVGVVYANPYIGESTTHPYGIGGDEGLIDSHDSLSTTYSFPGVGVPFAMSDLTRVNTPGGDAAWQSFVISHFPDAYFRNDSTWAHFSTMTYLRGGFQVTCPGGGDTCGASTAYDGYLVRYSVPEQGSVTPTPEPLPTGSSYCAAVDGEDLPVTFGWTGIEETGAPLCVPIGPYDITLFGHSYGLPYVAQICLQGITAGNLSIFGVAIDLNLILIIMMVVGVIRIFTS